MVLHRFPEVLTKLLAARGIGSAAKRTQAALKAPRGDGCGHRCGEALAMIIKGSS
jgi:hypothetical protein